MARVAGAVGVERRYKAVRDGRVQVVVKEVFPIFQPNFG